ncbi:MAG: DUF4397 domain-containing protein [Bacteroidales bacterium]|nr:DUF4397 domain-containing protein [Bacteroidales bacterium]MCF8399211.1 DUF4397 domain-containing protein [Bacteroidales bacterium]
MKTITRLTILMAFMMSVTVTAFSQARVQVIHNSADMAAQTVDVWLDDNLLIDNFEFRTATPFIDAPADMDFTISIQPANSKGPDNPLWSRTYVLEDGETYILVANGIVEPQGYNPLKPFDIYVYNMGREIASEASQSDVLVFHGATDAPVVDVVEVGVGAGTLVDDLDYSAFDGYLELPVEDYQLQIRDASGTQVVAQYAAPIKSLELGGQAMSILASGFLNPDNNNKGPSFGLYVAFASGGELIPLPQSNVSTARLQVIHNAADTNASEVDLWVNGEKMIDNFPFRYATPFADAPAGSTLDIRILPANSTSPDNPLWSGLFSLEGGKKYILVANGIVAANGYSPVQPFNLFVYDEAREMAGMSDFTDMLVFHGATDAPAVDIRDPQSGTVIVNDMSYGDFEGYLELPTDNYVLELTDMNGDATVGYYNVPLADLNLQNQAVTVVASGFLNPSNNNNGPSFGLFVALPQGGQMMELTQANVQKPKARVQVIHNSADRSAQVVDVWMNGDMLIDNFAFRTASPFVDVPAEEDITIDILPFDSDDNANPIASYTYNLSENETYILVANGLINQEDYTLFQAFDIYVYPQAREMAMDNSMTDVLVFHGATDAPTVDVVEVGAGAGTIVDDLSYGNFAGYLELPTADYILELRDENQEVSVANYLAPLATLGLEGAAISVVASGFLNPAENDNGPSFGLFVALPSGGELLQLTSTTSVEEEETKQIEKLNIYPNPARSFINVDFDIKNDDTVEISILDLTGKVLANYTSNESGNVRKQFNVDGMPEGLYLIRFASNDEVQTRKLKVVR